MEKYSLYRGQDDAGIHVLPLGYDGGGLVKMASAEVLPEVTQFLRGIRPTLTTQYILVNALGASEYYGQNSNSDAFTVASLVHKPTAWTGDPAFDRGLAVDWPYGFPTFYSAKFFRHHKNTAKDPHYGLVELAAWHPVMKRVELIIKVERDLCERNGGMSLWDKLQTGTPIDVSMGTKIPFDLCLICTDLEEVERGRRMFDPKRHRHEGMAILEYHQDLVRRRGRGIRGLSITTKDYCSHMLTQRGRILPSGKRVGVSNDYPRFFDISAVLFGADRTAKQMGRWAHSVDDHIGAHTTKTASPLFEQIMDGTKVAAVQPVKIAKAKRAEITKRVVSDQFAAKAIPIVNGREADFPNDVLDCLGDAPLSGALSTVSSLGMVLRPREFQRVILISLGQRADADRYQQLGLTFRRPGEDAIEPLSGGSVLPDLLRMLLPYLAERSAAGPELDNRVITAPLRQENPRRTMGDVPLELSIKLSSAYQAYRCSIEPTFRSGLAGTYEPTERERQKVAALVQQTNEPPLVTCEYFARAFFDEYSRGPS